MASSPESSPSGQANNNSSSTSSPPSNSPSPPSPSSSSQSPPPKAPPPSPSAQKSPPPSQSPSASPPASPPPKSPPSPSQKSPPSSPPPSSSSPPPSSPSLSSPPPSTPTPSSPPPSKNNNSPPPPSSSKTSPPPSPGVEAATPPPPSSFSSSPSTPNATPATSTSDDTPSTIFSPPPAINARSPPGAPSLTSPSRSSPGSSDSSGDSSNHAAIIAGAATGGALVLAVVVVALLCILRKRRRNVYIDPARRQPAGGGGNVEHVVKLSAPPGVTVSPRSGWGPLHSSPSSNTNSPGFSDPHQLPISPLHIGKFQFTYDELAAATGGFSQAKILGQGGFGYVYRGMLPNGQEVAVKTLKAGSGQGDREFQAEVEIISRVHHRHLVSLVGYSMIKEQRMLVYEFVSNGTLEFHLHGKGRPVMDWKSRLRIAVGSAKGLAYLHEDCHPKIIHRDIKAANILLDNNFEAMVADFGLAKFTSDDITHVSTRVMGTFGYMAPEYASTGKLTDKSDVFSFGVMLLELITGRRPIDPTNNLMEDSLVDWARPLIAKSLESGNYDELVDPRLEGNYDPQEMARMVSTAYSSIRYSAKMRPKMSQNVRTLKGDFDDERTIPGHSFGETSVYDTSAYNADMLKFKQMVMNSQEFQSSEFGDATNEYGQLSVYSDKDYNSINNSHNV